MYYLLHRLKMMWQCMRPSIRLDQCTYPEHEGGRNYLHTRNDHPRHASIVTSRLPEAGPAYIWQLNLGYRLPSQTNTSLFCALCPHSCAPGKNFQVGHPSPNFSESNTLNSEFFRDRLPEKKLQLIGMSILLILLSTGSGCHTFALCWAIWLTRNEVVFEKKRPNSYL